jgi:CIC family chloride channel protein
MKDIASSDIIVTTPSEDLTEVLKKFTIRNLHRLPVVKDEDHTILLGMLDRREVIQYYNQRVEEIKASHHRVDIESHREISQLKNIPVRLAMRREIETIQADMPIAELGVYRSKLNSFPVVDALGRLSGILSLYDCEEYFKALTRITQGDFAILPVVDKDHPEKLLGVISLRDIMSTYDDIVIKKGGRGEPGT